MRALEAKGVITKEDIRASIEATRNALRLRNILTPEELAEVSRAVEAFEVPDRLIPSTGMWAGHGTSILRSIKDSFKNSLVMDRPYTGGGIGNLLYFLKYADFKNKDILGKLWRVEKLSETAT